MSISRTAFAPVLGAALFFFFAAQIAKADCILIGAPFPDPSGSSYFLQHQLVAAQFTLSNEEYVTTIEVMVKGITSDPEPGLGFRFWLTNSLDGPTLFDTDLITTSTEGPNILTMTIESLLPADSYYLIGWSSAKVPVHFGTWCESDGTYLTKAGSIAAGAWISSDLGDEWLFDSGNAPVFIVNEIPEPASLLLVITGVGVFVLAGWRRTK